MSRNERRARVWKTIQEYKMAKGCAKCGYRKHPKALQFDHLGDKLGNVSDLVRSDYGWDTIYNEIKKCQVLCANCHAIETHERKQSV